MLYHVSRLMDIWSWWSLELLRGNLRGPILDRRGLIQGVLAWHNLLRSCGHLEILSILLDYKLPERLIDFGSGLVLSSGRCLLISYQWLDELGILIYHLQEPWEIWHAELEQLLRE